MVSKLLILMEKRQVLLPNYLKNIRQKNLNTTRPKNETEKLLLSISKNCQTLFKQNPTKPKETLEFKLIKPRETFS